MDLNNTPLLNTQKWKQELSIKYEGMLPRDLCLIVQRHREGRNQRHLPLGSLDMANYLALTNTKRRGSRLYIQHFNYVELMPNLVSRPAMSYHLTNIWVRTKWESWGSLSNCHAWKSRIAYYTPPYNIIPLFVFRYGCAPNLIIRNVQGWQSTTS